ncbi:MAG: anhydro-N-acetylmuramic acid kinase [Planctomycetota bacterium]
MRELEELARRLRRGEAVVAGVLSGTSADGIDVALARFAPAAERGDVGPPSLLAFATLPFDASLAPRLRALLDGRAAGPRELALLSRDLGRAFGRAASTVAAREGVRLELVGSHGQTVWHHDGVEASGPASLQLGELDFVAVEAGATAVGDFRQRDLAAGGEGAPLVALADGLLFAGLPRPAAVLNLGGMANLTVLPRAGEPLLAFDTGPANALLDGLARRLLDLPCDRDGAAAAAGRSDPDLVAALARHPFFARPPPKSTGRDTFGAAWVDSFLVRAGARPAPDLLACGVELVAESVAAALDRWGPRGLADLVVAGGGVHNRTLLAALARRTRRRIASSAAAGVNPDAREALAFAVLAARAVLGVPSTDPAATGARSGHVLGKIALARCRPSSPG